MGAEGHGTDHGAHELSDAGALNPASSTDTSLESRSDYEYIAAAHNLTRGITGLELDLEPRYLPHFIDVQSPTELEEEVGDEVVYRSLATGGSDDMLLGPSGGSKSGFDAMPPLVCRQNANANI